MPGAVHARGRVPCPALIPLANALRMPGIGQLSAVVLVVLAPFAIAAQEHAQPLAQEYIVVHEVRDLPEPNRWVCVGTPDIIQLPNRHLIASMELWLKLPDEGREGGIDYPNHCKIKKSTDGGKTWNQVGTTGITWGALFWANDALYLLGNDPRDRSIRITRSDDEGATWSETAVLFDDARYHGSATNVLIKDGTVYRAFESPREDWSSLVIAGDLSNDLTDPGAWRMSPKVSMAQDVHALIPPGDRLESRGLEGNIIDARGQLLVLLRSRLGGTRVSGMAGVCALTDDGTDMDYRFRQFHAMPGGQNKFKIIYDKPSDLFWTVATATPNPYQPVAPLAEKGFSGPPSNERRIAMLQYSYDGLNWFQAGCVAMSKNPLESFHYTSQVAVGDDLLVLSRTSVGGLPYDNHDTNRITLHRVKDFRRLALDLKPDFNTFGK